MKSFIQDLFGHQEWADAELWKAVEACPGALDQEDISKRFRHFHSTWFKDPTFIVTTTQALIQVAMHSQYHRGQNATRLRDVGGTPPTIDFVLWIWKGRPKAEWLVATA